MQPTNDDLVDKFLQNNRISAQNVVSGSENCWCEPINWEKNVLGTTTHKKRNTFQCKGDSLHQTATISSCDYVTNWQENTFHCWKQDVMYFWKGKMFQVGKDDDAIRNCWSPSTDLSLILLQFSTSFLWIRGIKGARRVMNNVKWFFFSAKTITGSNNRDA